MTDSARSDIYARVRRASHRQSAESIAREHALLGSGPSAALPHADPVIALMCNVLRNSGTLAVATDRTALVKEIGRYLVEQNCSRKLLVSNDRRLAALPWRDGGLLPRFGQAQDGEQAALSFAQLGIAETGSLVTVTGKATPSANILLPENAIMLVDAATVVPTLHEALTALDHTHDDTQQPRGINIISGPSRTADIAMKLVTGVHGPRLWHVIVCGVEDETCLLQARELADQQVN